MPNNVFYLSATALENYLKSYDRGFHTKDYEYHIALHAHAYYEKHLDQEFAIAFEVNNKPHNYPKKMEEISTKVLKEIITNYFREDTDVDFVLAPKHDLQMNKIGYPFQLKKFVAGVETVTSAAIADYINKKANGYHNSELSIIIIPIDGVEPETKKRVEVEEVRSLLKISDNALYAVFVFQNVDGDVSLTPIWFSTRVKAF